MSHAATISSGSFRKAFMLLGIYMLHLVFFQALMQAAPSYNIDNSFKTLFTNKSGLKGHNTPAARHPAVTYYTKLVQQGNDVGGCSHIAPAVNQVPAVITPVILAITFHIDQIPFGRLHLADDVFKVYRLIQVFLI